MSRPHSVYTARVVVAWVARFISIRLVARLVMGVAVGSFALGGTGCVAAPPGPRGPLRGERGLEIALDPAGAAFSSAEAVVEDRYPGRAPSYRTVSGTSDHYWAPFTVFPPRAELRIAPVGWMDVGGHLGWLDGGLELRFGLPASPSRPWAMNLAAGVRSGEVGRFEATKGQRALFGRLEAYPLLYEGSGRLVLALGLDAGIFYHEIDYRQSYQRELDGSFSFTALGIVRDELRLESAVGYSFLGRRGSVLAAIEPYVILDSGEPENCSSCVAFRQSFGLVIVIRLSLFAPFKRSRAP